MASKLPAADVISEEGGAEAQVFGSAKGERAGDGYWTVAGRSHCSTHVKPSNRGVGRAPRWERRALGYMLRVRLQTAPSHSRHSDGWPFSLTSLVRAGVSPGARRRPRKVVDSCLAR